MMTSGISKPQIIVIEMRISKEKFNSVIDDDQIICDISDTISS